MYNLLLFNFFQHGDVKSLLRKYERFRVSYIYLKFDLKCFSQALAGKIVCKSQLIVIFTI